MKVFPEFPEYLQMHTKGFHLIGIMCRMSIQLKSKHWKYLEQVNEAQAN